MNTNRTTSLRLPLIPAGTVVRVINADTKFLVASSAVVIDDTLLWGQTLIELVGLGRLAVDRTWVQAP